MRKITALVACSLLAFAACGDDDSDEPETTADAAADTTAAVTDTTDTTAAPATTAGDAASGDPQEQVADKLLGQAGDEGLVLDEECVRDKAGQLSDDDAQAILDAVDGGETPQLSADGARLQAQLLTCVPIDTFLDQVVSSLPEGIDRDCVREQLRDLDLREFAEGGDLPPELSTALQECVSG